MRMPVRIDDVLYTFNASHTKGVELSGIVDGKHDTPLDTIHAIENETFDGKKLTQFLVDAVSVGESETAFGKSRAICFMCSATGSNNDDEPKLFVDIHF